MELMPTLIINLTNNHQARWDQERQDHQWGNFDVEAYQRAIDQRLLDLEKRVEGCAIWLEQCVENSQGQAKEAHDQEQAYRQYLNQRLIDFKECIEWFGGRMSQYLEGLLERKEVEEPQQLHQSTYPFFCLTVGGIKAVNSSSSSECILGDVLLRIEEELMVEKENKEVEKSEESLKTRDDYLYELLLILDEDEDFEVDLGDRKSVV